MHSALFRLLRPVLLGIALAFGAAPTLAQSPFSAALYVNDDAITNYEVTQQMRFLEFLGATSDSATNSARERAIERLIEDRLQVQEAARLGGRLNPDQVAAGMAEFAARAQLSTDELLTRMQGAGIDRETYEDFVRAGLLWRELVRALYGPQVSITESQIDQALSVEGIQPTTEVLISEIFLPADPQFSDAVQRIIPQIQRIRSEADFANAARQVSAAPSAAQGGRVDRWVNIAAIPPEVGTVMATAAVGTVVGPIDVPGAYAFFQLRARRESRAVPDSAVALVYHRINLPGGRSESNTALVEQLNQQVDSCVDLPATALRAAPQLSESAVGEITAMQSSIDANIRSELERMNPGQISSNLVLDGNLIVLMLCRRSVADEGVPSRDAVRMGLINRALEGHGAIYMQRLRADADIRYP